VLLGVVMVVASLMIGNLLQADPLVECKGTKGIEV